MSESEFDSDSEASIEAGSPPSVEIPDVLPMLPVRDVVVFPYMILPLFVGREMVARDIPSAEAPGRLVELIKSRGHWTDP